MDTAPIQTVGPGRTVRCNKLVKIQVHELMQLDVSHRGIKHFLVLMTRGHLDRNLFCKGSSFSLEYDVVYISA